DDYLGCQPSNTAATVYFFASSGDNTRRLALFTAPGPFVPNSTKRASAGSYHVRVPVESTDDIRSQPLVPMWSSIQQSTYATALLTIAAAHGCHGRPSVTDDGAICGRSFFNRLFKNRNP